MSVRGICEPNSSILCNYYIIHRIEVSSVEICDQGFNIGSSGHVEYAPGARARGTLRADYYAVGVIVNSAVRHINTCRRTHLDPFNLFDVIVVSGSIGADYLYTGYEDRGVVGGRSSLEEI